MICKVYLCKIGDGKLFDLHHIFDMILLMTLLFFELNYELFFWRNE